MFLQRSSRLLLRRLPRRIVAAGGTEAARAERQRNQLLVQSRHQAPIRGFHATSRRFVVKPVLLADIGEGIVECEIIQWFVEPGARVEEFSPLCEVQSDKASVEITSRFTGVVKKLYYEAGEMAKVGKPFVDIDIQGGATVEELEALSPPPAPSKGHAGMAAEPQAVGEAPPGVSAASPSGVAAQQSGTRDAAAAEPSGGPGRPRGKCAALATPAVRHLSRELKVDLSELEGTGRDGRVTKEDIYRFVQSRDRASRDSASAAAAGGGAANVPSASRQAVQPLTEASPDASAQSETVVQLSHTQQMMFKTMTRSLSIPHFLYADEIDLTSLVELRGRLNKVLASGEIPGHINPSSDGPGQVPKLSYLPFIIKAVSLALYEYPVLNARVDTAEGGNGKPVLVLRKQHNVGVAMDTPQGLLVPVIKNVNGRNVLSIAAELNRLQALALAGRLSPQDMSGGTITVSNIGSIGGTYLSPVVVEREVAILGIGRVRTVPAFDEHDRIVKRQVCNFSWCADHRVVDGATVARAAGVVRRVVEEPDVMLMHLR